MTRPLLALLAVASLIAPAAAQPARAATDAELLRRHAPVLVLDAREPGRAGGLGSVDPFLRGARGDRARRAPARVYGHAVRDGGREWLQYWFFYPDNPQDRGIVRSGRHEGDWEMLQVGLGAAERPQVVTFAEHSWRQACAWDDVERDGAAPVTYVAHASHASYPRTGTKDRPWPDPNDDVRGDGLRVRPPVAVISDERPAWVASREPWGSSRAAWWNPAEKSSPRARVFRRTGAGARRRPGTPAHARARRVRRAIRGGRWRPSPCSWRSFLRAACASACRPRARKT